MGAASHSPDHALYAWAADEQGSEYFTIRVKDLATGEEIGAPVESAYGDFTFSPDSQWLFWIWRDARIERIVSSGQSTPAGAC